MRCCWEVTATHACIFFTSLTVTSQHCVEGVGDDLLVWAELGM